VKSSISISLSDLPAETAERIMNAYRREAVDCSFEAWAADKLSASLTESVEAMIRDRLRPHFSRVLQSRLRSIEEADRFMAALREATSLAMREP